MSFSWGDLMDRLAALARSGDAGAGVLSNAGAALTLRHHACMVDSVLYARASGSISEQEALTMLQSLQNRHVLGDGFDVHLALRRAFMNNPATLLFFREQVGALAPWVQAQSLAVLDSLVIPVLGTAVSATPGDPLMPRAHGDPSANVPGGAAPSATASGSAQVAACTHQLARQKSAELPLFPCLRHRHLCLRPLVFLHLLQVKLMSGSANSSTAAVTITTEKGAYETREKER
jgi:hypothetical protein